MFNAECLMFKERNTIMKKNYISPLTENIQLAGDSMMQSLNIVTGSGANTVSNATDIE